MDLDAEERVDPRTFISKSHNTPFGRELLKGKVLMTFKGGEIAYDNGSLV